MGATALALSGQRGARQAVLQGVSAARQNRNGILARVLVCAVLFAAVLLPANFARAQTPDLSAQRIRQIFTAEHLNADWFNEEFLNKVPLAKIQDVIDQLKFGLGAFKDVKKSSQPNEDRFPAPWGRYLATFKDGTDEIYIRLDDAEKINGLSIKTPRTSF